MKNYQLLMAVREFYVKKISVW